ncbi:DUF2130 domain-containing protein [Williamsoniiplasma lucivorax]|uniref:DUF2130 domain-containing protein n=1 Tax=Williamsoniiplasma lucivorax TaxID=209274 RepID=A0A2S5RDR4_9MOLU|nr:DUF2130 domain-containing protein [Williamsoniiplasma lucivorax]PPE05479.1 hypothetical protein ELUCI_v1c05720 [Williamsoniiplasma lucivorax]
MKNTNFKCPKCGQEFSLDELFDHNKEQFNEFINHQVQLKMADEIAKEKAIILREQDAIQTKQKADLEASFNQKQLEFAKIIEQLKNQLESIEKNKDLEKQNELIAQKMKIEELNHQEKTRLSLEASKTIEQLKNQVESIAKNLDLEKQNELIVQKMKIEELNQQEKTRLSLEMVKLQDKINQVEFQKTADIEHQVLLKEKEMQQIIEKQQNEINELNLKNSQFKIIHSKAKGENFENEVESELRKGFGYFDSIQKINDSIDGVKADFLQIVKNANNETMGKIVYEVKNAEWKDSWVGKLAIDTANQQAKYGILIATSFNDKYKGDLSFIKSEEYANIWITDPNSFVFVGQVIRKLIEMENKFETERKKMASAFEDNGIQKLYEKQQEEIRKFMEVKLPSIWKKFKKQFDDLENVQKALGRSAETIGKSKDILEKNIKTQIIGFLEKISGINIDTTTEEE